MIKSGSMICHPVDLARFYIFSKLSLPLLDSRIAQSTTGLGRLGACGADPTGDYLRFCGKARLRFVFSSLMLVIEFGKCKFHSSCLDNFLVLTENFCMFFDIVSSVKQSRPLMKNLVASNTGTPSTDETGTTGKRRLGSTMWRVSGGLED